MRFTFVPADRVVIVDGVGRILPTLTAPPDVHAVQWDGTAGHVEFVPVDGVKPPNAPLTSLTDWQYVIDAWTAWQPPAPPDPPEPPPITTVAAWAAKAILHEDGLLEQAEAAASTAGDAWPFRFAGAATWTRADVMTLATVALGLTEMQVDAMIARASALAAT